MKTIILIIILFVFCVSVKAQNNYDTDVELKRKIKELNAKAQDLVIDGQKYAAFAYMDSVAMMLRTGCKNSLLYVPQNIMPEEDKLSVILGYFDRQRRMILVEEKKVPNSNDETK